MQPSSEDKEKKPKAVTPAQLRTGARRLAGTALETLQEIMAGEGQTAVRLAAAREILDRGYGRVKLGEPEPQPTPEGMTVIVRKFTDPPGCREVDDGDPA